MIRAYTDGAVVGLAAAEPIYQVLHKEVLVEIDYTWHGKVENELRNRNTLLGETSFTDKVTITCLPIAEEAERFIAWMTDVTQGQGVIMAGEERYVEHKEWP